MVWELISQLTSTAARFSRRNVAHASHLLYARLCHDTFNKVIRCWIQLMSGLWMLSTRSGWDSCLESDGTTESEMMKYYNGPRSDFTVPSPIPSTHLGIWACGSTWRRHTGKHGSSAPHQRINQPTYWPHAASPTWSSTEQVARPATKRFHTSDWRPLETCCRPWTWWCHDATALAGYATMMMMMMMMHLVRTWLIMRLTGGENNWNRTSTWRRRVVLNGRTTSAASLSGRRQTQVGPGLCNKWGPYIHQHLNKGAHMRGGDANFRQITCYTVCCCCYWCIRDTSKSGSTPTV